MQDVVTEGHQQQARALRALFAAYQRNRDLINIGAYQRGADPKVDAALERWPQIEEFLKQSAHDAASFEDSRQRLDALLSSTNGAIANDPDDPVKAHPPTAAACQYPQGRFPASVRLP